MSRGGCSRPKLPIPRDTRDRHDVRKISSELARRYLSGSFCFGSRTDFWSNGIALVPSYCAFVPVSRTLTREGDQTDLIHLSMVLSGRAN
eukprot:gene1434-biopygen10908